MAGSISSSKTPSSVVSLVETNSRPLDVQLVNAEKTNKMYDCMDLVTMATEIQKADQFVRANAGNKLTVIANQMKRLQEEAKKVLEEAKRDSDLNHAACNFVKKPGTLYHLYERDSGQNYLSMLSLEEWGPSCPHTYRGGFRLELDMSWTPVENIKQREEEFTLVNKILSTQNAITDS